MRKFINIFLVILFLFSLCSCSSSDTPTSLLTDSNSENSLKKDYGLILRNETLELMRYKSNMQGFNIIGSSSDLEKTNYIISRMKEIGLKTVTSVPLTLDGWDTSGISLSFDCNCTESGIQKLYKIGCYPSNFNYTNSVVPLVNINNNDYSTVSVKNKGVLLNTDSDLKKSVELAISKGASFIIYPYSSEYDSNIYKVEIDKNLPNSVPIFVVSEANYNLLCKSVSVNSEINITLDGFSTLTPNVDSSFIIGEIEGKKKNDYIYITANRDSIESGFMSSNLNVAELLVLAQTLLSENYKPTYTLRFMVTTGHEWGSIDGGLNIGISKYLSDIDTSKIKYCLVLDGSKPLTDSVLGEIQISSGYSKEKDAISTYTEKVNEKNSRVKTMVNDISELYITEGLVWDSYDICTLIQSEPLTSKYYTIENTSYDTSNLLIDSAYSNYLIAYYTELIKLLN